MNTTTAVEILSPNKKFLYTFNNGRFRKYRPSAIRLFPNRHISVCGNTPVPFEDLGNCLLTADDLTTETAFEQWNG